MDLQKSQFSNHFSKILKHQLFRLGNALIVTLFFCSAISYTQNGELKQLDLDSIFRELGEKSLNDKIDYTLFFAKKNRFKDPKTTLQVVEKVLGQLSKGDSINLAKLYNERALVFLQLGDFDLAITDLETSDRISGLVKDSTTQARANISWSKYLNCLGKSDAARIKSKKAAELLTTSSDYGLKRRAKIEMLDSYLYQRDYETADSLINDIFEFSESNNLKIENLLDKKGEILFFKGNLTDALDAYLKAKEYCESMGHEYCRVSSIHQIGFVLQRLGLYKEALPYYWQVEKSYSSSYDTLKIPSIQRNLGEVHYLLGNIDSSQIYFKKCLITAENKKLSSLGNIYYDLALIEQQKGNFKTSKGFFRKARKEFNKQNNNTNIAILNYRYADLLNFMGSPKEAITISNQSIKEIKRLDIPRELVSAYAVQSRIYNSLGDSEKSLLAQKKADSIDNEIDSNASIFEASQKLAKSMLVNELKMANNSKPLNNKNVGASNFYYIIFLLLLTTLTGIFFLFFRRRKNAYATIKQESTVSKKSSDARIELEESEAQKLIPELKDLMEDEKVYLNANLSLTQLSNMLGTSNKKLSILLNEYLGSNFYDYLNTYRIADTKKMLLDKNCPLSIDGIAKECGFKTRSSFYKVFKKMVGLTPSQFKSRSKELF